VLRAAQADVGTDAQLASLAQRLGPLLGPVAPPAPVAAAGKALGLKLGLAGAALIVAGGGAWLHPTPHLLRRHQHPQALPPARKCSPHRRRPSLPPCPQAHRPLPKSSRRRPWPPPPPSCPRNPRRPRCRRKPTCSNKRVPPSRAIPLAPYSAPTSTRRASHAASWCKSVRCLRFKRCASWVAAPRRIAARKPSPRRFRARRLRASSTLRVDEHGPRRR